jgi:hypothetical protein
MAKVEFRTDIDYVAWPQFRHAARGTSILNFPEAGFAGASFISGCETSASFRAVVRLVHMFCAKHSVFSQILPQRTERKRRL